MKEAPPKRKPGRPTTFTPKKEAELQKLVSAGANFREACRKLKIDYKQIVDRRFADDGFHRRCLRATIIGTEANLEMAEARLKRSTNKRISVDREIAHHYRWKASKLLVAYKDKVDIDLHGDLTVRQEPGKPWDEMDLMEKHQVISTVNMALLDIGKKFDSYGLKRAAKLLMLMNDALYKDGREIAGHSVQDDGWAKVLALPAPKEKEIAPEKGGETPPPDVSPPSRARDSEDDDAAVVI